MMKHDREIERSFASGVRLALTINFGLYEISAEMSIVIHETVGSR